MTLSFKYLRQNSVCFAALWQFKTLYIFSEDIYISFQRCKVPFETPYIMAPPGAWFLKIVTLAYCEDHARASFRNVAKLLPGYTALIIVTVTITWYPAARVRARVRSCVICGGQSDIGAGFLQALRFPLPIIPPTATHSSSIIRGWYNRPVVASVIVNSVLLLNYTPTILGVQSWREITSGGTRKKKSSIPLSYVSLFRNGNSPHSPERLQYIRFICANMRTLSSSGEDFQKLSMLSLSLSPHIHPNSQKTVPTRNFQSPPSVLPPYSLHIAPPPFSSFLSQELSEKVQALITVVWIPLPLLRHFTSVEPLLPPLPPSLGIFIKVDFSTWFKSFNKTETQIY
jgi:hypothetical protein